MNEHFPAIRVIRHRENQGRGSAYKTGFFAARYPWVLMYDADGSTPPEMLERCSPVLERADIVIGSRKIAGAVVIRSASLTRRILSRLGNILIRTVLRLPYPDTQCGFKLFHKRVEPIFRELHSLRWGVDFELLIRAQRLGYQILQVPMVWSHKEGSTIGFSSYLKTLQELIALCFRLHPLNNLLVAILLFIIFFEVALLTLRQPSFLQEKPWGNKEIKFQEYADQIGETCSSSSYRPGCYDEEIPKLMEVLSMEEVFEVTRLVQEQDQEYWYCHVLGHNISAMETAKNPDGWKEVVARCPSGMCSNGCIHGAFQERFRAESLPDAAIEALKPELEGICKKRSNWNPTGLEQATCSHALGHLTMYITDADIHKSIRLCEQVVADVDGRNFSQLCYDGVFMQIFQPLEPEDFALVEGKQPTKGELPSLCNQFTGAVRSSCWTEGWPLSVQQLKTPEGLVEFCGFLRDDSMQYQRCYEALIYVLTAVEFNFDEVRLIEFCGGLPQQRRGQCFANAASRMVETDARLIDKSVALCSAAQAAGVEERCYQELLFYSTYNFHPESEEFFSLCSKLPDPWGDRCLAASTAGE